MAHIVCDTDFLLKVASESLPTLRAYLDDSDLSLGTIPSVVRELEGLARGKDRSTARKASFALRLVGTTIDLIEYEPKEIARVEADVALFECARKLDMLVATLDGKLLSRLERNQVPYLTLRHDRPFERSFGRATYLSTKKK